jgi:hypothetical protein
MLELKARGSQYRLSDASHNHGDQRVHQYFRGRNAWGGILRNDGKKASSLSEYPRQCALDRATYETERSNGNEGLQDSTSSPNVATEGPRTTDKRAEKKFQ